MREISGELTEQPEGSFTMTEYHKHLIESGAKANSRASAERRIKKLLESGEVEFAGSMGNDRVYTLKEKK